VRDQRRAFHIRPESRPGGVDRSQWQVGLGQAGPGCVRKPG